MEKAFIESIGKIKKMKNKIEKSLDVKLDIQGGEIGIESNSDDAYNEFICQSVLESLDIGFDLPEALNLIKEDYMLEKFDIKKLVKQSRLKTVMGRLIGEKGRTKELIEEMTGCSIAIKDHFIAVIGSTDDVSIAVHAIKSIIRGSPHAKVYAYLERSRHMRKFQSEEDLGLKKGFKQI